MSTVPIFKNTARLEYQLSFTEGADLTGRIDTASHDELVWTYYPGLSEPVDKSKLQDFQHDRDAEKQAFNILANRIYARLDCKDSDEYRDRIGQLRKGSITMFSLLGPCHSCRYVIKTFRQDFPTVSIELTYRNKTGVGQQTARLLPAGEGLFGAYGYDDAVQQSGGDWRRDWVGTPLPKTSATFRIQFTKGPTCTGTYTAVAGQPYAPYLYRAPAGQQLDPDTATLDKIAASVRDTIAERPNSTMSPKAFRGFIGNVGSGTVTLTCEQGPNAAGRASITAFTEDFPKVQVQVIYPGAAALSNGLGYADATHPSGSTDWKKVFPAAS